MVRLRRCLLEDYAASHPFLPMKAVPINGYSTTVFYRTGIEMLVTIMSRLSSRAHWRRKQSLIRIITTSRTFVTQRGVILNIYAIADLWTKGCVNSLPSYTKLVVGYLAERVGWLVGWLLACNVDLASSQGSVCYYNFCESLTKGG